MNREHLDIAICGATGRMGNAVIDVLNTEYKQHHIVGKIDSSTTDNELKNIITSAAVIIDFSLPTATDKILEKAIITKTPIVICTTGLSTNQLDKIEQAGSDIPILYAPNTSIGANLLMEISGKIAAILKDYDVEIVDTHHRNKKDAPSGTAIAIGKSIAKARDHNYDDIVQVGRSGTSLRQPQEIGISSLRSGGIYGRHDVLFASEGELITVSHQAQSRNLFAEGAIKAAIWLAEQPQGIYYMSDMLKL